MKRSLAIFTLAVLAYIAIIQPFTDFMAEKPFVVKLGIVPRSEAIKLASADQKQSIAAYLVFKVLFYFGTLVENSGNKVEIPPDYPAMSRIIHNVVKLDPYNMDAYYFAQAILVWDVKQIKIANELLDYGMKYRSWDWYLPFFAGFNQAYFLKDYTKASEYYKRAGELSGQQLHISLASRYMQESGQTEMAIHYLSAMEKSARNEAVRKNFRIRREAFEGIRTIEIALERFRKTNLRLPRQVAELVDAGYLTKLPLDPYGGTYYIDQSGRVKSTSRFASDSAKQ